jgi:hypothetical protein
VPQHIHACQIVHTASAALVSGVAADFILIAKYRKGQR